MVMGPKGMSHGSKWDVTFEGVEQGKGSLFYKMLLPHAKPIASDISSPTPGL